MRALDELLTVVLRNCWSRGRRGAGVVASLVWLVGAILCVTVLLLPLGLPVLKLGRRLFTLAGDLMHIGD